MGVVQRFQHSAMGHSPDQANMAYRSTCPIFCNQSPSQSLHWQDHLFNVGPGPCYPISQDRNKMLFFYYFINTPALHDPEQIDRLDLPSIIITATSKELLSAAPITSIAAVFEAFPIALAASVTTWTSAKLSYTKEEGRVSKNRFV